MNNVFRLYWTQLGIWLPSSWSWAALCSADGAAVIPQFIFCNDACFISYYKSYSHVSLIKRKCRGRWVVSFTPLSLYHRWKSSRYPLDRRLGGPRSRSGHWSREKTLASTGNRTPAVQPVAHRYTDWAIESRIFKFLYFSLLFSRVTFS
jgi:hypothetical protein